MIKALKLGSILICFILMVGCQAGGPMGGYFSFVASDRQITNEVQRSLYMSEDPMVANIHAESINGVVVLTGHAKKISQSDEAEMIARQVRGVKQVENKVIIRQY